MKSSRRYTLLLSTLLLAIHLCLAPPARALTIKEEKELSREFMKMVAQRFQLIKDPMIVDYVNAIGRRILAVVPPQPFHYRFYVIKEAVYNAFASPAGKIFIYSGLLKAMNNEDELAGILAHEIGHVVSRHISQKISQAKKINIATLAGLIAGVFLGAAGSGAIGSALTMGSMAAGRSMMLTNSRQDEIQADELGITYMTRAGYDGSGMITMLRTIRAKQWFGSKQIPTYMMTHPGLPQRLAYLGSWLASHPEAHHSHSPKERFAFQMMHARLLALYDDENTALSIFKDQVARKPRDVAAEYGYGLALSRSGNYRAAIQHFQKALEKTAFNPDILVEVGRNYLKLGEFEHARSTIRSVLSIAPHNLEGLYTLGQIELQSGQLPQAVKSFKAVLKYRHDNGYRQTLYLLGKAYATLGDKANAYYYLGLYYRKLKAYDNAMFQLERALAEVKDTHRRRQIKDLLREIGHQRAKARKAAKEKGSG